jgi:F0F1-type ATP synthase gamma subunit
MLILLLFFRNAFTVKERMVGTKNIEKITKSMKMVSAAKLRGDQNRLAAAIPFSVCISFSFLA